MYLEYLILFSKGKVFNLACWLKISAADILKYFSYFSQKIGFGIYAKETFASVKTFFSGKK